ncbi:MAG: TetR/AcrR family transcriptional regulator [Actinomycetota bacterium]
MSRLGRPTAADAQATRLRILDAARRLFASRGFDGVSNRALADEVGLTTGALYHYFDRKLDLYVAVYAETQRFVFERMSAPIGESSTFIDALRGVLEVAHDLNNEDPSLAQFLGSCRVDAQRDDELRRAILKVGNVQQEAFFDGLVGLGLRTGEIDVASSESISTLLRTVTIGLVDAVSGSRKRHRQAVDAIVSLFEGKLVRPPA